MQRSSRFSVVSLMLLVAVIAAACAPAAASTPQVGVTQVPVEVTRVVAGTPQVVVVTPTVDPNAPQPMAAGSVTLNGAGATFPDPVYTEWRFAYQYVDPAVVINYQAIGSGGGKKGIVDGTIDFAGSDSLLTTEYTATTKGQLQMFPTLAGAEVLIVNLAPEVTTTIVIDGPTLVGIYSAKITKWNDPALTALNPGVALPDKPITVVHRSDGSGTTEIFTRYLADVSEEWKTSVGAGQSVQWPVDKAGNGIGGKGNAGVAAAVQNTPYSIGYVELSYAVANKIAFADMVNKAGKTVKANAESLQAAMADYGDKFDDKLTIKMISNGAGEKSWPIAGYTYQVIYMDWKSDATVGCAKAEKYLNWVHWFLTDAGAAKRATDLGYATLPKTVADKVSAKLSQVTCDGKPVQSDFSQ
ncbi:MAG: phosphate ABC transporter substrate-binding protein PstS [Anaerolineae bacterium]